MCQHGDTVPLDLFTPGGWAGGVYWPDRQRVVPVDRCIADLVAALQAGGIVTTNSCCGHAARVGSILLADGRELLVVREHVTTHLARPEAQAAVERLRAAVRERPGRSTRR